MDLNEYTQTIKIKPGVYKQQLENPSSALKVNNSSEKRRSNDVIM